MGAPKLRLVFHEDGKDISYFHLERSEALRVIEILKILPEIRKWTTLSEIAGRINISPLVLQWTILKMAGAKYIDLEINNKRKVIAKAPIILIKKNHTRKNPRYKYLRPTIYVKAHL